jgi:Rps23 Pro-64 3,4-dihydroxylase Tpa1-like proline 4-hydroxylase
MNTTLNPLDNLYESSLIDEGVHYGNLFDFLNSEEIEYTKTLIDRVKKFSIEERDTQLYCRYNHILIQDLENDIDENVGFISSIKLSEVAKRDEFVKENQRDITQKWFEFSGFDMDCKYFMEISKKILDKFYPNININYKESPQFTLYEDGHFIAEHNDGKNIDRVCALIIYLSYDEDYNDGGGELIVTGNSGKIYTIKPTFGTFSLLDFTKNNLKHSVSEVKNGFKRYAFISFFNKTKIKFI